MNYSFDNSYDLYRALRDASPAERLNIVKQANLDLLDDDDWTVLMLAAKYGQTAIVDSLIKAGANKDIQDNDGWTALMYAAKHGYEDIVDLLSTPHQLIKDIKQKLAESEQKIAELEAQIARNNLQAKKIAKQRMRALRLGQYRR